MAIESPVGAPVVRIPMSGRAKTAVTFLVLQLMAGAAFVLGLIVEIALVRRAQRGETTLRELVASDHRMRTIALILLISFAVTGIAWAVWQHRAHRRLRDLGVQGLEFTPAWAVAWWLIPVGNLFMPYKAVKELWLASDPASGTFGWERGSRPLLLPAWWGTYLIAVILRFVATSMVSVPTADAIVSRDYVWIVSFNVWIVAGVLAIAVIREIDRRQAVIEISPLAEPETPARPDLTPSAPQCRRRLSRGVAAGLAVAILLSMVSAGAVIALRGDGETAVADPASEHTIAAGDGYERYVNPKWGFTLDYPQSWTLDMKPGPMALGQLYSPVASGNGSPGVLTVGAATEVPSLAPERLLDLARLGMETGVGEMTEVRRAPLMIGDLRTISGEYTGTFEGAVDDGRVLLVPLQTDGSTFFFFYTGAGDGFDAHRAEAVAIIESFRPT